METPSTEFRDSAEDDLAAMRRSRGSWQDRELDRAAWVEQLRTAKRFSQSVEDLGTLCFAVGEDPQIAG